MQLIIEKILQDFRNFVYDSKLRDTMSIYIFLLKGIQILFYI